MAEKRYFWLKLQDTFFSQKEIKKLRKIAGGDTYTIIYLKLQLISLRNGGKIYYEGLEETFYEEMALELDEDSENVKFTILFLEKYGLIQTINENEYLMTNVEKSTGSETQEAVRVRRYREKQKALQCNGNVTKCNVEIEKEKEIEIEKEIEKEIDIEINKKASKPSKPTRHKYGEYKHVLLTDEQHTKLINELGTSVTNDSITFLDEYIEMKGYKARNHYLCIKKWVVDAVKEKQLKANKNTSSSTQNLKQLFKEAEDEENGISSDINDPF